MIALALISAFRFSLLALPVATIAITVTPLKGPAGASEFKGVVELFTSQGCSSCPPADAELARLAEKGEVLALSYHVDYWNYKGWVDTLATKASTSRQYGYAKTLHRKSVYTPQAMINGLDHANGANPAAIKALVDKFAATGQGLNVDVDAVYDDAGVTISIGSGDGEASIVVVYFDDANTVEIERGENAGSTITYRHSVREIETVGMWGGAAHTLRLPASVLSARKGSGCAILLQVVGRDGAPGRILGAAMISGPEAS
ncbi:MAG: thioredoxin family protein [Hoeflea sp.]